LLTSAPGIGKKNAERILVELRPIVNRKYADLVAAEGTPVESSTLTDVEMALRTLGYSQREISNAVRQLGAPGDRGVEELVRDALQLLSEK